MRRLLAVVLLAGISAVVGDIRPAAASVSATVFARPDNVSQASCPWTFTFHATLSFDQPGPITYRWIRSDGAQGPTITKNPSTAGHYGEATTWTLSTSYSGWEQLEILAPQHVFSNRQSISLTCLGNAGPQGRTVSATVFARPDRVTGAQCPYTFTFHANIVTNAPGPMTFRWIRSDGAHGPDITKNPSTAGHFGQMDTWTLGASGTTFSGWEQIEFLAPYHTFSNRQSIALTCQ